MGVSSVFYGRRLASVYYNCTGLHIFIVHDPIQLQCADLYMGLIL